MIDIIGKPKGVVTPLDEPEPTRSKRKKKNPDKVYETPCPPQEPSEAENDNSDSSEPTSPHAPQAKAIAPGLNGEIGFESETFSLDAEAGRQPASDPAPNFKELPPEDYPQSTERPCYRLYLNPFVIGERFCRPGVYLHTLSGKGEESYPIDIWLCAPLKVLAKTASREDGDYGRLLEFESSNRIAKKWSMPSSLLAGDGVDVLERLYAEGLEINYTSRKKILDYISSTTIHAFLHCATRTGWHSTDTFVLPDYVIGSTNIWFQSNIRVAAYAQAGDLQKWQTIARQAIGNRFLIFGISFSLCGPLLSALNIPGVGIHVYGDSTTGKTTLLQVGSSCWGNGERYKRSWRATANGLEGVCVQHTDTLLAMDEIAEISARDLDQVAYFAVNGQGKSRATRHGEARPEMRWRLPILSCGEQSVAGKLASDGRSIKAGQQMRLLDIPVSGKHGLFDNLHGFESGAAFSDALRAAANTDYGHAGPALVKAIIQQGNATLAAEHARYVQCLMTGNVQEDRVASQTFALAALAGEVASQAGILPWPKGTALAAANAIFCLWCEARKANDQCSEHAAILADILDFINAHSSARFSVLHPHSETSDPIIRERAGWWEDVSDKSGHTSRIYIFTPKALREATKGYAFSRVTRALKEAAAFFDQKDPRPNTYIPAESRETRLYWIRVEKLEIP
jgi:putative DNA primase/helicase